ncbi:guanine permease [candidate division GN15 bacterium]|uniref:Guanine permease n=1 Tax=candidate division GN15 bacterium TaxID=2072418 RepID=A0A855X8X0_9BACT|nr:MAG: guanine permease [candidate division GN15 bacterium]
MLSKYFQFQEHGANYRSEVLGGITTFFAMAYIIVVNPAILAAGGIPKEASTTATILAAVIGTLVMALYARRPFAIAPYMGENAFIAFTVCLGMGFGWEKALGALFISGVIFMLITVLRIRSWIATAIPDGLKRSFAGGIGFFIMFIGLNETGLIRLGIAGAPVKIGDLSGGSPLLAVFAIVLISILMIRRIPGAILIGMLVTTVVAFFTDHALAPQQFVSLPPSLSPVLFHLDIRGALTFDFLPVILVLFVMAFVDTMGTLIGLSARAGLLDKDNNLPEIEKPMMADAVATTSAALLGTSTTGAFIESAAGIEAGARTGFASLVTAGMFLVCLFLAPIFVAVPAVAYGAALIVVGFLMITPLRDLPFHDYADLFPAVATIAVMAFSYNIGFGMATGFVLYPIFQIAARRGRSISAGAWILFVISALLFIFYPYERM